MKYENNGIWFRNRQLERLGITQRELARRIGVQPSSMTRTFQGKRSPEPAEILALARELQISERRMLELLASWKVFS